LFIKYVKSEKTAEVLPGTDSTNTTAGSTTDPTAIVKDDGSAIIENPDGTTTIRNADGTAYVKNADGTTTDIKIVVSTDG
jgi:hypothetical protein